MMQKMQNVIENPNQAAQMMSDPDVFIFRISLFILFIGSPTYNTPSIKSYNPRTYNKYFSFSF